MKTKKMQTEKAAVAVKRVLKSRVKSRERGLQKWFRLKRQLKNLVSGIVASGKGGVISYEGHKVYYDGEIQRNEKRGCFFEIWELPVNPHLVDDDSAYDVIFFKTGKELEACFREAIRLNGAVPCC
jgi:hypothetical protein